jgi:hypothetical protein
MHLYSPTTFQNYQLCDRRHLVWGTPSWQIAFFNGYIFSISLYFTWFSCFHYSLCWTFVAHCYLSFFQFCGPTESLTFHKKNEPNLTYTWNMKVKTFKHPSTFMAINYWILIKENLVTWNFFSLEFGKCKPFFKIQIPLLTSKCHFLGFELVKVGPK